MKYLRNIYKMSWKNDGFRSLYESAIYPEVTQALEDWKSNYEKLNYVLVGGLALSFYLKPRPTQDIVFLSYDDIPNRVEGFKKKLEIIGSSTDYKSFNGFKIEESKLLDWLCSNNESGITNLEFIKNKWNNLNTN